MKMRTLLLGLLTAGFAQGAAGVASAGDPIQMMLHTGPESTDLAVIKVDGKPNGRYDKVLAKTLEYDIYVRGDRPSDAVPDTSLMHVWLEGGEPGGGGLSGAWKQYTLTMPYRDPADTTPAKLCNQRLKQTAGAAREKFLKKGETFSHPGAYKLYGSVDWIVGKFPNQTTKVWREEMTIPVKIKCLGLNRNLKDSEAAPRRTTPPLPPLFAQTSFRIEPAKAVKDGKYLCPSQLKLYGYVETTRKFQGKAIFMGPHYLSALTSLHFSYAGSRNVVATYPMKWQQVGGLAATPGAKPKKQTLTFRFNISDQDGKLIKSMEKTVAVSCSTIKPNPAAIGGEMTVTPGN